MNRVPSLENLPIDLIGIIVELIGYKSATRLIQCSTSLKKAIDQQQMYHQMCNAIWPPNLHNIQAFHYDYKELLRNKNGWFPLGTIQSAVYLNRRMNRRINRRILPTEENNINRCTSKDKMNEKIRITQSLTTLSHYSYHSFPKSVSMEQIDRPPNNSKTKHHHHRRYQISSHSVEERQDYGEWHSHKLQWIPEIPVFDIRRWSECPSQENIMDLRLTNSFILIVTAGWKYEVCGYIPVSPQMMPRCVSCEKALCCCSTETMDEPKMRNERRAGRLFSDTIGASSGSKKIGGDSVLFSPRAVNASGFIEHNERNSMEPLNRSNTSTKTTSTSSVSHVCIRDLNNLKLIQRLKIETPSINCIDGGDSLEPMFFAFGGDSGEFHILRRCEQERLCPFQMVSLGNGSSQNTIRREINDLRLAQDNTIAAVRTHTRYPSHLEIFDIPSETSTCFPVTSTMGWWIHALELYSTESTQQLFAIGENSFNGLFAILHLDLRTRYKIASINMQTRQMLWPLRVYDNFVIANSATPVWESEGFVYIWDRRWMPSMITDSLIRTSNHELSNASVRNGTILTFPCGLLRCEDFSYMHNHIYVYGMEGSNLTLARSSITNPTKLERITNIDPLISSYRLTNALKLFNINESTLILESILLDDDGVLQEDGFQPVGLSSIEE